MFAEMSGVKKDETQKLRVNRPQVHASMIPNGKETGYGRLVAEYASKLLPLFEIL